MLALTLQEELNAAHEQELDDREHMANKTPSKLVIRMARHRAYPQDDSPRTYEFSPEEEADEWDDSYMEAYAYDRKVRSYRDRDGAIVTKHNKADTERKNRKKMEERFPIGFNW